MRCGGAFFAAFDVLPRTNRGLLGVVGFLAIVVSLTIGRREIAAALPARARSGRAVHHTCFLPADSQQLFAIS